MICILGFLDSFSLLRRIEDGKELRRLRSERDYYKQKTEEVKKQKDELLTDTRQLEKFAREHYFMKKSNEEIFIVEE